MFNFIINLIKLDIEKYLLRFKIKYSKVKKNLVKLINEGMLISFRKMIF